VDLRVPNSHAEEVVVAAIVPEGEDIVLMVGPGDHSCQRFKLTESLARKLRRELNERLD
jgi:hypothetical protein